MIDLVCWWLKDSAESLKPPPPAYKSLGASQDLRKLAQKQETYLGPGSAKQSPQISQVRKYARLLQLEEIAMEDQIRRCPFLRLTPPKEPVGSGDGQHVPACNSPLWGDGAAASAAILSVTCA